MIYFPFRDIHIQKMLNMCISQILALLQAGLGPIGKCQCCPLEHKHFHRTPISDKAAL